MMKEEERALAQMLAEARRGTNMPEMGGAHNPLPSEELKARRFVEDHIDTLREKLRGLEGQVESFESLAKQAAAHDVAEARTTIERQREALEDIALVHFTGCIDDLGDIGKQMQSFESLIENPPVVLPPPRQRRAIREAHGISQRKLGAAIGVSGAAVCRWESGVREPRGETRDLYSAALGQLRG